MMTYDCLVSTAINTANLRETTDVHFVDVDGTAELFAGIQRVASLSFLITATHSGVVNRSK